MEAKVTAKIALTLIAATLLNLSWPVQAQIPPGPYPSPPPGPGYPPGGYPGPVPTPPGAELWARCDQLAHAEQDTAARLQYTPPSPERAQLEQQLREIAAARQPCWPR